jgi:hypothetical protein
MIALVSKGRGGTGMRFSIYALLALLTTADAVIEQAVPRSTFVTACNACADLPDAGVLGSN